MKYIARNEHIPQERRRELNDKILYLIDAGLTEEADISREDIYNAYTGDGGLHGLQRSDYDSYSDFSDAKKEIENGQFFTPPSICQMVAKCIGIGKGDLVADLTCGIGNFFNFMPTENNLYGCEIDNKAYKVARHLYPDANIVNQDIRLYQPGILFDYVLGNPPFNLKWWVEGNEEMLSQLYYCIKAYELLKPCGLMAIVVPKSFVSDDFTDGGMIREMTARFRFLGQFDLPKNSFASMGVASFPTKLQFWQKKKDAEDVSMPYTTESTPADVNDLLERINRAKEELSESRMEILKATAHNKETSADFSYQVDKMLYQIRVHPRLSSEHSRCCAYVHRFYTEKQPESMKYEEWCRVRLTEPKVLNYLKKVLKKQNERPQEDRIALVKRDYDFVYKGYSYASSRQLSEEMKTPVAMYLLASSDGDNGFTRYAKLIRRKQREYTIQNQQFADMELDVTISNALDNFTLWDAENEEEIRLNPMQKRDINLMLQKRYGLLQWEQGCGKTLAGIAVGLYRMECQNVHHTWIISSAISIRNNWDIVLKNYGLSYVFVEELSDFAKIKRGDFVIITLNGLRKYQRQIKRWVRIHNENIQLIFDESDEISNASGATTKACLDCFRRCKYKLLETGTSTRNNISEFAPQQELLYNNSFNMLSWCDRIYKRDKESGELYSEENDYFGMPIPAYKRGYTLFSNSHLPEKITVFGVGQRTQDIYNADVLSEILGKTVISRTFEEITGKDIRRIHQVPVRFSEAEKAVYQQAIEKFYEMRWNYFQSTGNSRKDSMMVLMQQILTLLRISAAPSSMSEYVGDTPVKIQKVLSMIEEWDNEIVAIGVRHIPVLEEYRKAIEEAFPDRPLFVVTGGNTSFAKRRALRKTLKESGNGILLCTQQSLPSSVNFEYVNKIIIPELHYNNSRMSQFYMRFIRYTSTEWKDIYFVTYAGSIESNLMQMVMAKEKLNLFMKGQDADLDEIYDKFGVDYNLLSLLMRREADSEGKLRIRWGEQNIA